MISEMYELIRKYPEGIHIIYLLVNPFMVRHVVKSLGYFLVRHVVKSLAILKVRHVVKSLQRTMLVQNPGTEDPTTR